MIHMQNAFSNVQALHILFDHKESCNRYIYIQQQGGRHLLLSCCCPTAASSWHYQYLSQANYCVSMPFRFRKTILFLVENKCSFRVDRNLFLVFSVPSVQYIQWFFWFWRLFWFPCLYGRSKYQAAIQTD